MEALRFNYKRLISPKLAKKLIYLIIFSLVFDFCLFPFPGLAKEDKEEILRQGVIEESIFEENISQNIQANEEKSSIINNATLPENPDIKVKSEGQHVITAYNSEIGQCDSTPCVTANGFNVCEHGVEDTIAANFLPFGTKIRIPDLFGDRVFVVRDRMNAKHYDRIDVWMVNKQAAKKFGVKVARIEVLE